MNKQYKISSSRSHSYKAMLLGALVAAAGTLAAGCGKQAYVVTNSQAQQQAPGMFTIPPKVDILIVQDDTGGMIPIFSNISSQLGEFLGALQNQGWDYHLATIPLTTPRTIQQVQASKYDPNWGSEWIAPYPGALSSQIATVSASAFRTPDAYSDFLNGSDTSTALNGQEPGLENIKAMLQHSSAKTSGFLRQDALLAVIVITTGDDTSGRNYCSGSYARTDNWTGPCDLIDIAKNGSHPSIKCGQPGANPSPYCNNYESSLNNYKLALGWVKGWNSTNLVRFYSIVSPMHYIGSQCMGANAFVGARYQDMASYLKGQSYDICTMPVPSALDGIASNLSAIQYSLYTHYLFMASRPEPSTIVVWRNPGGDTSLRTLIPYDPNNGWTLPNETGYVENVLTTSVGSPTAAPTLNQATGWAVKLNGSARIGGSDTATVEFKPYGVQNSVEE